MRLLVIGCLVLLGALTSGCSTPASSETISTPTATASSTSTSTPTATPTEPAPTSTPLSSALPTVDLARSFWSGPLGVYPLAVEMRPGRSPASEPWQVVVAGELFTCLATTAIDGWLLDDCVGDIPDIELTIEVPQTSDGAMTVTITTLSLDPPLVRTGTARLVHDRDEAPQRNVTQLWTTLAPDRRGNTDIWSADGVVFAPNAAGHVQLLAAGTGEQISLIDLNPIVGISAPVPAALDVKARDGLLYIATASRGVFIYDVSDPARPQFTGWYVVPPSSDEDPDAAWNIHNIFLSPTRDILYVINQSGAQDLRLIDVSDPTNPVEVGRYSVPNSLEEDLFPHDVNVVEQDGREIAYANYWDAGLRILDTTDPGAIVELGVWDDDGVHSHAGWPFESDGRRYYAHGGEGHDQGLTIVDVTDPQAPVVVGYYESRDGISIHNIEVRDGLAYIAYYIDGLRVVDLSDPTNPVEVAHYDTVRASQETELFGGAWGVRFEDGRVFISDRQSGVFAFTIDLPSAGPAEAP